MSVLARAFERRASPENPGNPIVPLETWGNTVSGAAVTYDTALGLSAVFACVRVIAEAIAALPLKTFKRTGKKSREEAPKHPLAKTVSVSPNPEMTKTVFLDALQSNATLTGNGFAMIERVGSAANLWPLPSTRVQIHRIEGQIWYVVNFTEINLTAPLLPEEMLHVPGLTFDGVRGLSPIDVCKESVGVSIASEDLAAKALGRGFTFSGVLEHPGQLGPDAIQNLRKDWEQLHAGNQWRMAVLEEGMKFQATSASAEDAQFIEQRKFQIDEIARIFKVPPHMIGSMDSATFSNIEEQSISFVRNTLRPWLARWREEYNRKLFGGQDRFFVDFVLDDILRGDSKARSEVYSIGRTGGWLSVDDIRALENMPPLPDEQGENYLIPMNMRAVGGAPVLEPPPAAPAVQGEPEGPPAAPEIPEPEGNEGRQEKLERDLEILAAARQLASDQVERMERIEQRAVRRIAQVDGNNLIAEIDAFYIKHRSTATSAIVAPLVVYQLAGGLTGDLEGRALDYVSRTLAAGKVSLLDLAGKVTSREGFSNGLDNVFALWKDRGGYGAEGSRDADPLRLGAPD